MTLARFNFSRASHRSEPGSIAFLFIYCSFLCCLFFPSNTFGDAIKNEQLLNAVATGDHIAVSQLTADGIGPNLWYNQFTEELLDEDGGFESDSLFVIAAYCGCPDIVDILLDAGAKPTELDLSQSIQFNQLKIAKRILPFLDNARDREAQIPFLLLRKSQGASLRLRQLFLDAVIGSPDDGSEGIDYELSDDLGDQLPEDMAADFFEALLDQDFTRGPDDPVLDFLGLLIADGYDIEAQIESLEFDDMRSARHISSLKGDVYFSRALSTYGASLPNGWNESEEREIQLVGAAMNGISNAVELLLSEGVSANSKGIDGTNALAQTMQNNHFLVARKLIEAGADVSVFGTEESSPLVSAARGDQVSLAISIIENGANIGAIDGKGLFALREAARYASIKTLRHLLINGASPNKVNQDGETSLHGFIRPDEEYNFIWRNPSRTIHQTHLEAAKHLIDAGIDLNIKDIDGVGVLESNIDKDSDLRLLKLLLDSGTNIGNGDFRKAIKSDREDILRILLRYAKDEPMGFPIFLEALNEIQRNPGFASALLEHGVALPSGKEEKLNILKIVASGPSNITLGLLLKNGITLDIDPSGLSLAEALINGRKDNVALLLDRGVDLQSFDESGNTFLHRVIKYYATSPRNPEFGESQQKAMTLVFEAGYQIDLRNQNGKTIIDLASEKPDTLESLNKAIAASGSAEVGIHAAIREKDFDLLRELASQTQQREKLDILGRTPLSFSLQLSNWTAARILLRSGAKISQSEGSSWQPADISFMAEDRISSAFAIRLLLETLIDIPEDTQEASLMNARMAYNNRSPGISNFKWNLNCRFEAARCGAGTSLEGNITTTADLIESRRLDQGNRTLFGLLQKNLRSIRFSSDIDLGQYGGSGHFDFGEMTFIIDGSLEIGACQYDEAQPFCAPGVKIRNPNERTGLSFRTDDGYEELPTAVIDYIDGTGKSGEIEPGNEVVLDRSEGPIKVNLRSLETRVFSLWIEVQRLEGQSVEPLTGDDHSSGNRMKLYYRLLKLRNQLIELPDTASKRALNKTVSSTIAALSVESFIAGYHHTVLELLKQQANAVAALDQGAREIQDAVRASATLTPDQIGVLIAEIDLAIQNGPASSIPVLEQIKSELVLLRIAAEETGAAVNSLRYSFRNQADLTIERYQALILEYKQYVSNDNLETLLSNDQKEEIKKRIFGREVVIKDNFSEGTGAIIRNAFGLPAPTP